jgi:hypothetical protein
MAIVAVAGVVTVVAGGVMPAVAEAATATKVSCSTPALVSAVSGAASGATLSLAKGCTYVLTAALPAVAQDLTIDGNGATLQRSTAAGTAVFTILTITADTVVLNQLNFKNGNGAITVDNIAQLSVTGGVFSGNTAANGAAINNTGATIVQVTGASFIDNTATDAGGAIFIYTAFADQFTDCSFQGNTAAGVGGAMYDWATTGTDISGSTFRGNAAPSGGALYLDDEGPYITESVIGGNSATGDGGGIFNSEEGEPVTITGSTITGNSAGGVGGGLDEESAGYLSSMTDTIVKNNTAVDGGGINDGEGADARDTGDTISGNRASGNGGGINAIDSYVTLSGTTLSGNHANGDGGGFNVASGSKDVEFADASFTDSTISGNHAGARGGGLYNQGPVKASDTQITGNRAVGGGGGIYDYGAYAAVTLTNSSPTDNKPDNCEPLGSIPGCPCCPPLGLPSVPQPGRAASNAGAADPLEPVQAALSRREEAGRKIGAGQTQQNEASKAVAWSG